MALGRDGEFGDAFQLGVVQHPGIGLLVVEIDDLVVAVRAAHDLERLVPEPDIEHFEGFLGDDVGIGLDLAGNHDFAQSERALDDHPVLRTVARIGGERDAGFLGVDHLLDHHCHGGLASEVAAGAVGDHARREQRHPAAKHRIDERLLTADVGDGCVHPGERRIGAVLAGCGGAHGDNGVRAKRAVGGK